MIGSLWFRVGAVVCACFVAGAFILNTAAEDPANPFFRSVWERTDKPVADGLVGRTWQWGPQANSLALDEPYAESPGGQREVQYYDKSRMEITQPTSGDPASIWYVTNGLLVVELMSGRLQLGDSTFEQHPAATVNVAGDADDTQGPTYASLAGLRSAAPLPDSSVITQTVNRGGTVGADGQYASHGVTAAEHVTAPGIDHQVASPFWSFMNASGPVYENGTVSEALLFQNPYFATGLPITEAYWAQIKVAGTVKPVLLQCFERRCLTYTPDNPAGWQVEQGNVGQHYYQWRYGDGGEVPTATATATATEPDPDPSPSASEPPATDYSYTGSFGLPSDPARTMQRPQSIAFDSAGNFYVVDATADRIQKYDPNGLFITQWGGTGTGNGQFNAATGVAVDASGNVYVVDAGNHRIQRFDQNGAFLLTWGSEGTLAAQFNFPSAVAVDAFGNVYVADSGNHRIQKFTGTGVWVRNIGSPGKADGQLSGTRGVVVDAAGQVYVSDTKNYRVQVFDANGGFLRKWGEKGAANGQFDQPYGIALSLDETRVYVADWNNNRVQVFDPTGAFLTTLGSVGTGVGELTYPTDIAFSDNETLYVADSGNKRVQIFDVTSGASIGQVNGDSRGHFLDPLGMAVTADGEVVVVDDLLHQVKVFADGVYVHEWSDVDLAFPYDVAIDSTGILYVTDTDGVLKYSLQGQRLGGWGGNGTGNGQFKSPAGIAIDADDNVYVVDTVNNRVQKFTAQGTFITAWGSTGNGPGQFDLPEGIAVWGESVYVTDSENQRVQEFDRDGGFIRQWGSFGTGEGQFNYPIGIAVDGQGSVYVADYANNRVQKFTPTGEFLAQFGSSGSGDGQFDGPFDIAIRANGDVYVSDSYNQRVVIFNTPQ